MAEVAHDDQLELDVSQPHAVPSPAMKKPRLSGGSSAPAPPVRALSAAASAPSEPGGAAAASSEAPATEAPTTQTGTAKREEEALDLGAAAQAEDAGDIYSDHGDEQGEGEENEEEEEEDEEEDEWSAELRPEQAAELEKLGLGVGHRIEVNWDLEIDGQPRSVWWPCELCGAYAAGPPDEPGQEVAAAAGGKPAPAPAQWRLLYDEKQDYGFDAEVRRVVFSPECPGQLVDKQAYEEEDPGADGGGGGGGGAVPMAWRPEGGAAAAAAAREILPVGTKVKALWMGGQDYHAGEVLEAPADGGLLLYKIKYDDGAVEENVPAEYVERRAGGAAPQEDDIKGIDAFWTFITSRVLLPLLQASFPADKQLLVAEAVQLTKPDFVAACERLKQQRGAGAAVDGEDIREHVLPVIMPRVAEHVRRLAAQAS